MDSAQVAQDRDAGHVFAVEGQDARRLLAEARGALGRGNMSVDMLVLLL